MARQELSPTREITISQRSFVNGMVSDLPITEIPKGRDGNFNAVADSDNWLLFPDHAEVRSGTYLLGSGALPARRTGLTASKSGATITCTAAQAADVGSFFVWDDGSRDYITAASAGVSYTVTPTIARSPTVAGKIVDDIYALAWHDIKRMYVLQLGQYLYYQTAAFGGWTQIYCSGPIETTDGLPAQAKSIMVPYEDYMLLFNTNGIYKVDLTATPYTYARVNNTMRTRTIGEVEQVAGKLYRSGLNFGRRYITTMAQMSGTNYLQNRLSGNTVVQESGPNKRNNDLDLFGYAEVFQQKPWGYGDETYAVLTGGTIGASANTLALLEAITDLNITFKANSKSHNIAVDFSGIESWEDAASRVQVCLRDYWKHAIFEYDTDHWVFTMPDKGDTIDFCAAGTGGTDGSGSSYFNLSATPATIANPTYFQSGSFDVGKMESRTLNATWCDRTGQCGLYFLSKYWIFGGVDLTPTFYNDVYSSSDGVTWTSETQAAAFTARTDAKAVVLGSEAFIMCGVLDTGSKTNTIYKTTDMLTWSLVNTTGDAIVSRWKHAACVHNSKIYLSGGQGAAGTALADLYYSSDGTAWTKVTAPGFTARYDHVMFSMGGYLWIVGGRNESGTVFNDVWKSTDGTTFTQVSSSTGMGPIFEHSAFVLNGVAYIYGGMASSSTSARANSKLWKSTNGTTWTEVKGVSTLEARAGMVPIVDTNLHKVLLCGGSESASGLLPTNDVWEMKDSILHVPSRYLSSNYYACTEYTHYGIYATMDIGPAGIDATSGAGNQPLHFDWVDDVPVCKSFVVTSTAAGLVTASSGTFSKYDIGSKLVCTDGTEGIILTYISPTQVTWNLVSVVSALGASIGTDQPFKATQESTPGVAGATVTISAPAGGRFTANDVGKRIFWSNGTWSIITAYTSATVVTVGDTTLRTAVGGAILDSVDTTDSKNWRKFCDTVEEDDLEERIGAYYLKTMQFIEVPDCSVGAVIPGMVVCGVREGKTLYQMQLGEKYNLGYYDPFRQFDTVEDGIEALRVYPNRLSAICMNSTVTWDTTARQQDRIAETGQVVEFLTTKSIVDYKTGTSDWGSIQSVQNGVDILRTNLNEIRTFNGAEYGENIAANKLMKALRKMHPVTASSYDSIGGYYLWGTESALSNSTVPFPDICWRFALIAEQGVRGGIRITGTDWVKPSVQVGSQQITDASNFKRQTVLCSKDGKTYWLSTYDGPTGSGLAKSFLDKYDGASAGSEITGTLKFGGHIGFNELFTKSHNVSYFNFRPYSESNRSVTGYTAAGYRSAQAVTIYAYKDNDPTNVKATMATVPISGEVTHQEKFDFRVNQWAIYAAASEIYFVGSDHKYQHKDYVHEPSIRAMTESTYQLNLATPAYWWTRGPALLLNRANNATSSGTATGTTGPDSKANSAIAVTASQNFGAVTLAAGTILIWTYGTVTSIAIGSTVLSLTAIGTSGSWTHYYQTNVTASGNLVVTAASCRVFDIRLYNSTIDSATRTWLYNDLVNNGGSCSLPRW